jgi:hypothetical protein
LVISLSEGDNNRNVFEIKRVFNIDMKTVRGHKVKATPVGASDGAREVPNVGKNIIRKLHNKKYMYIYPDVQFLSRIILDAEAKAIAVHKPNNVVLTEHILYLSIIGLYELLEYRLA